MRSDGDAQGRGAQAADLSVLSVVLPRTCVNSAIPSPGAVGKVARDGPAMPSSGDTVPNTVTPQTRVTRPRAVAMAELA